MTTPVLWVLLPIVVFLAAYTPGAVNFVVGQASFTVFVVVLFNILAPQGWRTGLVRVQDVAIGAGISVVVGALLWPRGARGVARRAFADLLRAGGDHVRLALAATLDGRPPNEASAPRSSPPTRATAPSPRWRISCSSTVAGRSTGRRGARCSSTPGCSESPVTASPAPERHTRSPMAVDRPGPRWRRRVAPCAPASTTWPTSSCAGVSRSRRVRRPTASLPAPPSLHACLATHASHGLDGAVGLVWVHEWLTLVTEQPR